MSVDDTAALPTEFRLFKSGVNSTENGDYLFDEEAARLTMAAFERWGVDLAIDLEHAMLDPSSSPDPTAKDARGWCRLEVRNGELWAVGVKWTDDGAARLSEKRQRYISPAFGVDPDTSRVTSILNVAIVAMPATHETPALVAASVIRTLGAAPMNADQIKEALDALVAGDADKCMELLKGIIATAASGGEAPAEAVVEDPVLPASAAPEKQAELVAASALLMRLTGKTNFVDAVAEVDTFRTSHLALETERQTLAKERGILEAAERRKGCVDLVTLAGIAPATVWSDDKSTAPKKYLASMPIADFRDYVADAIKASAGKSRAPVPPATTTGELSAREIALCAAKKIDPAKYAATKQQMGKT